jgi:hypothetical protein
MAECGSFGMVLTREFFAAVLEGDFPIKCLGAQTLLRC